MAAALDMPVLFCAVTLDSGLDCLVGVAAQATSVLTSKTVVNNLNVIIIIPEFP